jgi:hypothetical protein
MNELTEKQFLKDVKNHQMQIIRDDGVYRHIRFGMPDTYCMSFNLITWPGHLCYAGDMGTYVFTRLHDMFEFFRTDRQSTEEQALFINRGYWAEKLVAVDKNGGVKEFSEKKFNREIMEYLIAWVRDSASWTSKEERRELWNAVVSEVIKAEADSGGYRKQVAANEFSFQVNDFLRFSFKDFWEVSVTEYTHRFLWCCYAIAWGLQQYDNRWMAKPWRCNVLSCGNGECVHELTDEQCPHCKHRMVRVKPTGFMFCSNPSDLACDYEDIRRMQ